MGDDSPKPWQDPRWLAEAHNWLNAELSSRNLTVVGDIDQFHIRPWATVMRVPLTDQTVYFKAVVPQLAHEIPLTQALMRWRPDCMPHVLATNAERGWFIVADAGVTVRSLNQEAGHPVHWHKLLPLYAEVQMEMVYHVDELLATGLFDYRLSRLPQLYIGLLEDVPALMIDQENGMTTDQYQALRDLTPTVMQMCQDLASYNLPETLHHDDFHDANVFWRDNRYTFADWGEAAIAHPFFTMKVMLNSLIYQNKLEPTDPLINDIRDTYLAEWAHYAAPLDLLKAYELAQPLAMICRALSWYHIVNPLPQPHREIYLDAVSGWLVEFLDTVTESA